MKQHTTSELHFGLIQSLVVAGCRCVVSKNQFSVGGDAAGDPRGTTRAKDNSMIDGPRLEGIKVVGDANVPSSQYSFIIDSAHRFDPDERIGMDQRLVVAFPPNGPVVADISGRRGNIVAWYRGMGQINRIQGVWEPDWVGIDFIVSAQYW